MLSPVLYQFREIEQMLALQMNRVTVTVELGKKGIQNTYWETERVNHSSAVTIQSHPLSDQLY